MNIILVEGIDGAGKTTFIEKLSKLVYRGKVAHFTQKDVKDFPDPVQRYYSLLAACSVAGYETVILDRGWYSDLVYGRVLRNADEINWDQIRIIERMCAGYGSLTIFKVTTSIDTAWKRCKERGEDLVTDKTQLKFIAVEYAGAFTFAESASPATFYEVRT